MKGSRMKFLWLEGAVWSSTYREGLWVHRGSFFRKLGCCLANVPRGDRAQVGAGSRGHAAGLGGYALRLSAFPILILLST